MFFKIFSTLSIKISTAGTTQPTGRQGKPAQPPASPNKKASALGRLLKALKPSRSNIQQCQCLSTTPPPLEESFYTPNVGYDPFSRYPTFDLDDLPGAVPFLGSSTLAAANIPPPPPPRSPIATPKTIDSGYLSVPSPEGSPRPSSDLRRDPQVEARQLAMDRLVGALEAGPQRSQDLRHSEVDHLWDAEEAKALAKEEEGEEEAKGEARRSDLQVKSDSMLSNHGHLIEAGLQAKERRRRR